MTRQTIAQSNPWFEQFHEMINSWPATGPLALVHSGSYDPTPTQQTTQQDDDAMDESDDPPYSQSRSIPALDSLSQSARNDPFAARVISTSSSSTSIQFTPPTPPTSAVSTSGASSSTTPSCQRSASTAFGVDGDNDMDSDSAARSSTTGTPKKSRTSSSKNKRDHLGDILKACAADTLAARIQVEEERTKREQMRLQFQREENERKEHAEEANRNFIYRILAMRSGDSTQQPAIDVEAMLSQLSGNSGTQENRGADV